MKNYLYIFNSQDRVEIYYTRAINKKRAINKLLKISNTPKHLKYIIEQGIKELKDTDIIFDYNYPDYEG